ncbi:MAG: hypothetical protein L6Q97_13470, partial [Thermoanaerobaculia bacterium]|nr:hypothetical protein [Thermoanaerobaculia bacterium]
MVLFRKSWFWLSLIILAAVFWLANRRDAAPGRAEKLPEKVDFNWHIRPILSDRCFACHGPDENKRQAGLRLDTKEGAFAPLPHTQDSTPSQQPSKQQPSNHKPRFAIVPGHPEQSELVRRIYSTHPDSVMPVPESHLTLSDFEKKLLVRWIEQGAPWKEHWAFIPPERPA